MTLAPGPRGSLILGNLAERRRNPLGFFIDSTQKYGPVVRYKFGPKQVFLINEKDAIKRVLQDNHRNYRKGYGYDQLRPVLGRGLLTSEGDFWMRQRKLAQPAFHRARLMALTRVMTDATAEMLEAWEPLARKGEPVDINNEMMKLTMTVVARTLLGSDVSDSSDKVARALGHLLEEVNRRVLSVVHVFEGLPTPRNIRYKRALETLDKVVFRIIQDRRRKESDQGDLLSMLVLARDEETGEGMNDRQLRDEVMTMFLAGHETTANALSWMWYLLSRHPDVDRRFRAEVREAGLARRVPEFDDLGRLPYTEQVLEETLRLYPPAWLISREAIADDELAGYRIPKDSILVISPYVTHRNTAYWENPEGFDPERFAGERAASRHRYEYFPFSGGPRVCIGSSFATMEAKIIAAMVAAKFRLHLVPGQPVDPLAQVTLRPRNGLYMTLHEAR